MNHAVTVTIEVTPISPSIHSEYAIRRYVSSDSPKQKVDEINELLTKIIDAAPDNESTIRAWRVQNNDRLPVIVRTVSAEKAKWALLNQYRTDPGPVTIVRAPEFDWNSNLLPGDIYSLEHAEAGNKKPAPLEPEWHNPENVSQEQLGEGYRFLVPWEVGTSIRCSLYVPTEKAMANGEDGWELADHKPFAEWTYRVPASTPIPPKPCTNN